MNKRELNKTLNEIIELRKQLKEKEEMLFNGMTDKDLQSISTAHGQAYITEESTSFRFDTTRFKEEHLDLYNENLKEITTKRHITIKESK
jgi:predicted phage-related endonuclease